MALNPHAYVIKAIGYDGMEVWRTERDTLDQATIAAQAAVIRDEHNAVIFHFSRAIAGYMWEDGRVVRYLGPEGTRTDRASVPAPF